MPFATARARLFCFDFVHTYCHCTTSCSHFVVCLRLMHVHVCECLCIVFTRTFMQYVCVCLCQLYVCHRIAEQTFTRSSSFLFDANLYKYHLFPLRYYDCYYFLLYRQPNMFKGIHSLSFSRDAFSLMCSLPPKKRR